MKRLVFVFIIAFVFLTLKAQNVWNTPACLSHTDHIEMLDLIKFDGSSYILYTIEDEYCHTNLVINKLDNNGQYLWNNPMIISEINQYSTQAKFIKASDNSLLIVWNQNIFYGSSSLYAQKVNTAGQTLWPEAKLITNTFSQEEILRVIPNNAGGMVISWQDYNNQNQNLQVLNNQGNSLYPFGGLSIPESNHLHFRDMIISDNYLCMLMYNTSEYLANILKINIQDASGSFSSHVIQEECGFDTGLIKNLSNNHLLVSLSGEDGNRLKLLDSNFAILWSKDYDAESALAIETINDSLFAFLTEGNTYKIRKMNLSGSVIDSASISSDYPIGKSRLSDIVKYDNKIMFSLQVNYIMIGDLVDPLIYVKNIIYTPSSNNMIANSSYNANFHAAIAIFNNQNYFLSSSDATNTSFIIRDYQAENKYLFNTLNNNNFSYVLSNDLVFMNDFDYPVSSFSSESINNKSYFLSAKDKIYLSSLNLEQESTCLHSFGGYMPSSTQSIRRFGNDNLLIALNSIYGALYSDYFSYMTGAWIYNEENHFTDSLEISSGGLFYFKPKMIIGETNQDLWLAANTTNQILLFRSQNDSLLWDNEGQNTGLSNSPLSINNGYLISLNEDHLLLHKYNPDGSLYDPWPESGVEIALVSQNYNFLSNAESYLTSQGLLILWGNCLSLESGYHIYAKLLNTSNGNTIWSSSSELALGRYYNTYLLNNKLYLSYLDSNNSNLKVNCYSLDNNQLNLLWSKTVSSQTVLDFDMKLINNRFVYSYTVNNNNHYKTYVRILSPLGNLDQFSNGYLVYDSPMQTLNAKITSIGQNQAMVSFLGYNNPEYKNQYAALIDLTQFVGNEDIVSTIDKFNVYANYPNPFNPSTYLSFDLNKKSRVEISIYNIKGQKVRALSHDIFERGKHSVMWDGKDDQKLTVSSGIYFARVRNEGQEKTIRMLMLK